ncbi:hypothetical protein [Nocardioides montaniterrae]
MKQLALATTLAATLALAGCGGSDDPTPLTHAQLVKQGNAICKQGTKDVAAVVKKVTKHGKPTRAAVLKATKEQIVPIIQDQRDRLDALEPPKTDAVKYADLIAAIDKAIAAVKADPAAAMAASPFDAANQLANGLGLTVCGKS